MHTPQTIYTSYGHNKTMLLIIIFGRTFHYQLHTVLKHGHRRNNNDDSGAANDNRMNGLYAHDPI